MDYYSNCMVERHLIGGALVFWADFAPFADSVRPEHLTDPTLLAIWQAAVANEGDITALPLNLQPAALACVEEYNGADPGTLITRLEDAAQRRKLQDLAVELVRLIDGDEPVAEIIARVRERLSTAAPTDA